ncbi:MAG TPA: DNA-binding response regulator, partial [Chloroflexi bacterium]|nr:DNA-binding response regulator [Chloroflexota bacterium]
MVMNTMKNEDSLRSRTKILVVDDEQRMIHFIRMNLDLEGFSVHEAYDGKDALNQIRKVMPDLVILDVMMPKMDG